MNAVNRTTDPSGPRLSNWTRPADLRAQLQKRWDRGELLRARVGVEPLDWPLRLSLRTPRAADLAERFEAVRHWLAELRQAEGLRIEWRDWQHRVQGSQSWPVAVWVDTLDEALALIGQSAEADRFAELWAQTTRLQPLLLPWLAKRPLQALEHADRWGRLLAVIAWMQARPRPGVYVRQVDVPGVDSKFIEAHRGVLAELLDLALSPEAIDAEASGAAQFNRRYGFLDKPVRFRLRLLDARLPQLPGCSGLSDITLDAASFASLALPVARVFVTENEVNFLAFPAVPRSIVVFGAGYGWEALAAARWLADQPLHYWGDLDTHGFAILDQLRAHHPQAQSLLMDLDTLMAHRLHWGEEPTPTRQPLARLSDAEIEVYDALRYDRIATQLRLEQERVGYGWVCERLAGLH